MSKNYKVLHYIKEQVEKYNGDSKLYDILSRSFNLINEYKDPDGCLSTSIALYICLTEAGYEPKIRYGLIKTTDNYEYYHAWLEMDDFIIDLAIYGNANFNSLFDSNIIIEYPVVLEKFHNQLSYHAFLFDDDWQYSAISAAEHWTLYQYIMKAPMNGMHKIIGKIANEAIRSNIDTIISKYKNVRISDFKEEYIQSLRGNL